MIHDKKNFTNRNVAPRKLPAAQKQTRTQEPAKEKVSLGDRLVGKAYVGFPGVGAGVGVAGVGAAAAAAVGAGSLAAMTVGLSALGAAGAIGGMIGGIAGGLIGDMMGGVLAKNAEEATNQQRTRRADGRFRTKSGATHVDTLRETYGPNFAAGLPGNMPLQVLRATTGMSLTQLVKHPEAIAENKEELGTWQAPELAPGGRTRNADGRIRQKRSDTKIDTLRDTYGLDFAAQLPGNWPLAILRESTGKSLSQLVKTPDTIQSAMPDIVANASGIDEARDLKGNRESLGSATILADQTSIDMDPRDGKVSMKTMGKSIVGDIDAGFYSYSKGYANSERITHQDGKDNVVEANLQHKVLFGDKPLAPDLKVSYHEHTGEILSVEDNSVKKK
jgi:hypothetical protein